MMRTSITCGWRSMKEQVYILILVFIYRLLWGYFLYGFIRKAVVPILLHYPDSHAGGSAMGRLLYYVEGQLSLQADPAVQRWLWMLLGLSVLRLLLTPFIRAGLLHELHQERKGERGLFFFPGMKKYGLSVLLFSLVEWVLALVPVCWFAPKLYGLLISVILDYTVVIKMIPYILAWLLYLFIVRLLLLYMQFGYTGGTGMFSSLLICLRHFIPAAGISILLGAGGLAMLLLCTLTGFFYPGFVAFLVRQLSPLPSTFFKMWGIAAQYHLWSSKSSPPS